MDIKFKDNSARVLEALKHKKQVALETIGLIAEGYAKRITPVDTGRLRNSISNAVVGDAVYIGTNVEYGPYVEFGATCTPAHHMLQHAAQDHGDEYKAIAEKAMKT